MIIKRLCNIVLIFLFACWTVVWSGYMQTDNQASKSQAGNKKEEAYRANNIGVALLEQYKHKEGAEQFARALQLDPNLQIARVNLAIALYNVPDMPGAQREAEKVVAANPNLPQPHYILGLIAKSQNRTADAVAAFKRVLEIDPSDVGANVNLGQLNVQAKKYTEAIANFRAALATEPYNGTAAYNLGTALLRNNSPAEGQEMLKRFQALRNSGAATSLGQSYLEQGRYAEAIVSTGAEADLVDKNLPNVTFTNDTAKFFDDAKSSASPGPATSSDIFGRNFKGVTWGENTRRKIASRLVKGTTLFDLDGDGDLDLLRIAADALRLYRNDGGKFVDVTTASGALSQKFTGVAVSAVAGDYDNDLKPDLFLIRDGGLTLFHNDGNGKFSDVTAAADIPSYPYLPSSVAFADVDHDGDLDIFVAGLADLTKAPKGKAVFPTDFAPAQNLLLRNNGDGKFTNITEAAKVVGDGRAVAVVPIDYNNLRDVDLLVVKYGSEPDLFSNQRDATFKLVTKDVSLDAASDWTCVAAGDVNKDGFVDFFLGRESGPGSFALSDGRGKYKIETAPAETAQASASQFFDYDNDGLLDLIVTSATGRRLWRNVGNSWIKTGVQLGPAVSGSLSSGDLDADGDTDLVITKPFGAPEIWRNNGGNQNNSVRVNLTGRVSNRSGVGARIDVRAGSLTQRLDYYSASPAPAPSDIVFGIGKRSESDAVRILWPAGIVQAETEIAKNENVKAKTASSITLGVTELDRKPSSCPYLYTWNGERFEFITDFMGGGEMGYWEAPGLYNHPDPDEYVRIRGDQLKEKNGYYEIRVTNELEEVLFIDHLKLIAVAHPKDVEIYPDEGMGHSPYPSYPKFKLYKTKGARPPVEAFDDNNNDVLSKVTKLDRTYPDDFKLDAIRGYAGEHTLTLKLDQMKLQPKRTLLLLTGWTDYAFSSDNVAASQASKQMKPPALQVKDEHGTWRTVINDIGIPIGRPQTVTVDLTGKFLSPQSREVRIVTNMRVYYDQILVDTSDGNFPVEMSKLAPLVANLGWRGYSAEVMPDGKEPIIYDYSRVSFTSPWKAMPGRYTREGDVRELLAKSDDLFVISRTGDELILKFDAKALPRLPEGWTRTFLFYGDGFSKELDINSATPHTIGPLPFHGMKRYPYSLPESYPMTEQKAALIERYNTRVVRSELTELAGIK